MEDPRWIRQDRNNAEVGGKLKQGARSTKISIEERLARLFENDKNGDGRLSRKEYQSQRFGTMDRNNNGFITKKEAAAAFKHFFGN